jgi:hypothetical protein
MDCDQRQTGEEELTGDPLGSAARLASEHVPEKWVHFSDKDMLHLIELARILVDRVIPPDRNTHHITMISD